MPCGGPPVRAMPTAEPLGRMTTARLVSMLVSFACAGAPKSRSGVLHGPSGERAIDMYVGPLPPAPPAHVELARLRPSAHPLVARRRRRLARRRRGEVHHPLPARSPDHVGLVREGREDDGTAREGRAVARSGVDDARVARPRVDAAVLHHLARPHVVRARLGVEQHRAAPRAGVDAAVRAAVAVTAARRPQCERLAAVTAPRVVADAQCVGRAHAVEAAVGVGVAASRWPRQEARRDARLGAACDLVCVHDPEAAAELGQPCEREAARPARDGRGILVEEGGAGLGARRLVGRRELLEHVRQRRRRRPVERTGR